MFYQVEVNRIAHTGTRAGYGDTVALIKNMKMALAFARDFSGSDEANNCMVHVTGRHADVYFKNGHECHWSGRRLTENDDIYR